MSVIHFEVSDAAEIRFCISPLWETVRSLHALGDPGRHVVHLPWVQRMRQVTGEAHLAPQLELLHSFVRPGVWMPDFLTPPPPGPLVSLEEELAVVRCTQPEVVIADLQATTVRAPLAKAAKAALTDPLALLPRLTQAIRVWHDVAIAPHWTRMRALLEADIAHRARQLAEGGALRLFNTLHPTVHWAGDRIVANDPWNLEVDLRGRGLPLMPSVFVDSKVLWNIRADSPPIGIYPARAAATLWEGAAEARQGLAGVMGATRARLLDMLQVPATTTELARRLDLSPAAVSQNLQSLHAARLVTRSQHGRSVLYVTTELGIALLR